jgi:hypothetical protein
VYGLDVHTGEGLTGLARDRAVDCRCRDALCQGTGMHPEEQAQDQTPNAHSRIFVHASLSLSKGLRKKTTVKNDFS